MASILRSLIGDSNRYLKALTLFKKHTTLYRNTYDFIDNQLPNIMPRNLNGKSHLNIIGVGSGSGEIDINIISMLRMKYPSLKVDNEVVEPEPQQIHDYKDLVSQTPGLDHVTFNWNQMTAEVFEEQWKGNNMTKKADLIHMFQMLYFVKDPGATISFFHSLLNKNAKLLLVLLSDDSGAGKLVKNYGKQLRNNSNDEISYLTTAEVKPLLEAKGLKYRCYKLPAQMDATNCYVEGNEEGELLFDFTTEVHNFKKSVPPELKAEIMEFYRHHACSLDANGKIQFNLDSEVLVVDRV
ncbi:histamine N-methyltransferase-like [Brachionichthys hirsutus]|uniref:histamine N-methyltransferase-like n=1 Tax=Brachionichthys hirsutus TaxID=412623 RepID=UPI003604E57A